MKYLYLALAIISEVTGSSFLNASNQFSKPLPSVITVISYLACFYFLSVTLKYIPLGVAYAIWGGLGIVLTAIVSVVVFKSKMDLPAIMGILLIVSGVLVLNFLSKTNAH
ncbi:DMT family transporter [Mucilaginibacter dorajii]|uniref:Quaternary ammonium compound efflux SMR transporter QacH n=1 Tax=Mucilaginibacter dorajii TaxID=692994 RepID=A0ABP7Q116_9SPHI|nr:multidrug efflux SMR transporter [Mucilaginibacter dorajii]MCS3736439.1 small multidrug resistance pump [Mucilaginibacter dorajii]